MQSHTILYAHHVLELDISLPIFYIGINIRCFASLNFKSGKNRESRKNRELPRNCNSTLLLEGSKLSNRKSLSRNTGTGRLLSKDEPGDLPDVEALRGKAKCDCMRLPTLWVGFLLSTDKP